MSPKNTSTSSNLDTKEFQEVLSLFFNALPDPIYVIDQTGLVIKVLGGNANKLNVFNEQIEGNNLSTILPCHLKNIFMDTIAKAIIDNELTCIDYQLSQETKEQSVNKQWYQGRVFPLEQRRDDVRSVLWVAVNITEKKLLELELKKLAEKDDLTSSYNRRYFTEVIHRSFSLYLRDTSSFCVLMLDIDFFKAINDNFGHDGGDTLLVTLTNVFKREIRDIDLLARYGGEEFIFLLPNTTKEKALIVAERIRLAAEEFRLSHYNKVLRATVSIGVSEVNVNDTSHEQVIKRADLALYTAKVSGRNQVCGDAS